MPITRVWIEEGCISCGMSKDNCPEVFTVGDNRSTESAKVIEGVYYSAFEDKIKKAADRCPVGVIMFEES
jgi:ferredoxin